MIQPNTHSMGAFDAKTHFSKVLDRVEHGETIAITRHGRTVAKIVPVEDESRQAKAKAAFEQIAAIRKGIQSAPVEELIKTIHEGHRY